MQQINDIPPGILLGVSVLALCVAVMLRLASAALSHVTRSSARDARAAGEIGTGVLYLVENRDLAKTGAQAARLPAVSVLSAAVLLLCADVVSDGRFLFPITPLTVALCVLFTNVLIPSSVAARKPLRLLKATAWIVFPATKLTALFIQVRESDDEEHDEPDDEAYELMVERVRESDILEDNERDMINSVIELGRTIVRTVMVPRTDMITIGKTHTLEQALRLFSRSGFSRVPVIGDSADELLGILYLKDIIRFTYQHGGSVSAQVTEIMRPPNFVPETMSVDDLLHKMQATAVHISLVADEYGGIAGLVTIEDLLEELVGEMTDEHDRATPEVEKIGEDEYRVPSRLPLTDLGELFDLTIEDDDVDTVGGLLAKVLGRVPIVGSHADVCGLSLTAEKFEGRRKRIVTIVAKREKEGESDGEHGKS